MGLVETLKKCAEQRNNSPGQWRDETEADRKQRILRQKMRVYPGSAANKNRVAPFTDVSSQVNNEGIDENYSKRGHAQ
jgi:hypothetical protein